VAHTLAQVAADQLDAGLIAVALFTVGTLTARSVAPRLGGLERGPTRERTMGYQLMDFGPLAHQLSTILGGYNGIGSAVEDNQRQRTPVARQARRTGSQGAARRRRALHRSQGAERATRCTIWHAGTDAHRCKTLRVDNAKVYGHTGSRRNASYADARRINGVALSYLRNQIDQFSRFTQPAHLAGGAKPVPAAALISARGLLGVEHQAAVSGSQLIHRRAGGKVIRILATAVQHQDEWAWACSLITGWQEEAVASLLVVTVQDRTSVMVAQPTQQRTPAFK
jgi:hypothetical protein